MNEELKIHQNYFTEHNNKFLNCKTIELLKLNDELRIDLRLDGKHQGFIVLDNKNLNRLRDFIDD